MDIAEFAKICRDQAQIAPMERVILHWTAGGHDATEYDKKHYHLLIDGEGRLHLGTHEMTANSRPIRGDYAPHVRGLNTGSVGIAVCGMAGGKKRGPYITPLQMETLHLAAACVLVAWGLEPSNRTVCHHGAVERVFGVAQRGKWDINWLKWYSGDTQAWSVSEVSRIVEAWTEPPQSVTVRFFNGATLRGVLSDGETWVPLRKALELMGTADTIRVFGPAEPVVELRQRIGFFKIKRTFLPFRNKKGTGFVPVRPLVNWLGGASVSWDGELNEVSVT